MAVTFPILTLSDFYAKDIKAWLESNPNVLSEADEWYKSTLSNWGLAIEDTISPLPYAVKQCAVLHVSMRACRDMLGVSLRQSADGVLEDPYETKYQIYKKDYADLYDTIGYDMLAGRKPLVGIGSSKIWRS